MYDIKIGNLIVLDCNGIKKKFVVKEFVLDSMMNSTMCSSTRILLSNNDFHNLYRKVGEVEYLIEGYFKNSDYAANFKTKYENAGMPANGQAITYSMIFLLSALTDLTSVFVIFLVSILLILIGVAAGYSAALIFINIFTKHLTTTFGNIGISISSIGLSFLSSILIFFILTYYCKKILKKIRKLTIVDALVNGNKLKHNKEKSRDGLYKDRSLTVNILMPLREIFFRFKDWIIVFLISLISVFMILVPVRLINTMNSEEFVTYMGCSANDIRIEVKNGEKLEESYKNIKQVILNDKEVKKYDEYRSVCIQTYDSENEVMNLHVECGKDSGQGLKYLEGNAPKNKNQIALSCLNADKLGKKTGDEIKILCNGTEGSMIVSGIYQDVTSGGYTAKSIYEFICIPSEKYSFSVNIGNDENIEKKASKWADYLGSGIDVEPMKVFLNQTFGGVVNQLESVVYVIVIIGVFLEMLIAVLFLRLRLAKDLSEIAVLKAIGFSENDIKVQYSIKMGITSLAGAASGIILTGILGERIINIILRVSGLGIKKIELIYNPIIETIIVSLCCIVIITIVTLVVMRIVKKYDIVSIINE